MATVADSLAPWDQPFRLSGADVGPDATRHIWGAVRVCLPQSLAGLTMLDVGSGPGFMALSAAAEGAEVTAIDQDTRIAAQHYAVRTLSDWPAAVITRVKFMPRVTWEVDLRHKQWDAALLSSIHYHLNQVEQVNPYRQPVQYVVALPGMRTGLALLLEDLLYSTDLLVVVTNTDHLRRVENPYPSAAPAWVMDALRVVGFRDVTERPGWNQYRIIVARGHHGTQGIPTAAAPPAPPGPNHLTLMLGWRCNAACIQCWQAASRASGLLARVELSKDDILAALERWPTVASLELCSFGETLMWPGIEDLLTLADDRHITVNLISNGSLLDRVPQLARVPGHLTLSIDSPSPETYASIRVGLTLNMVTRALARFLRRKIPERTVGVNMVLIERNKRQVPAMAAALAASRGGVSRLNVMRGLNLVMTDAADEALVGNDPDILQDIQTAREKYQDCLQVVDWYSEGTV